MKKIEKIPEAVEASLKKREASKTLKILNEVSSLHPRAFPQDDYVTLQGAGDQRERGNPLFKVQ